MTGLEWFLIGVNLGFVWVCHRLSRSCDAYVELCGDYGKLCDRWRDNYAELAALYQESVDYCSRMVETFGELPEKYADSEE